METRSFHPMGSEDARAKLDDFLRFAAQRRNADYDALFAEPYIAFERVQLFLLSLRLADIQESVKALFAEEADKAYAYVIPYAYLRYHAFSVNDDIKKELKKLLRLAIYCFANPYSMEFEMRSEIDYNAYENLLDLNVPEDSPFYPLHNMQTYLANFEDIFAGKVVFFDDGGLVGSTALENETKKELDAEAEMFHAVEEISLDSWQETYFALLDAAPNEETRLHVQGKMAKRGDIAALRNILESDYESYDIDDDLEWFIQLFDVLNHGSLDEESVRWHLDLCLDSEMLGGHLYKERLGDIYSYFKVTHQTQGIERVREAVYAYQDAARRQHGADPIPDFTHPEDTATFESFLALEYFFPEDDVVAVAPISTFRAIRPEKVIIPSTIFNRPVVAVTELFKIGEVAKTLVIGKNVKILVSHELEDTDLTKPYVFFPQKPLTLEVDPENPYFSLADNILYSKDGSALLEYPKERQGAFVIPATVISLGADAFYGAAVEELTFGPHLTAFEDGSLAYTRSLKKIIYLGKKEEFNPLFPDFKKAFVLDDDEEIQLPVLVFEDGEVDLNEFWS